jgi:hypothetical protein
MPFISAACQFISQIYSALPRSGALRYMSKRFSRDVIPRAEKKSLRGQAFALATLEYLSSILRLR